MANQPLNETRDLINALEAALTTPPIELAEMDARRPGAYLMLYRGRLPYYARVQRPGGRRDRRPIATGGGAPIYIGSASQLRGRTGRYMKKLPCSINVSADDLLVVPMPTSSHAGALYLEGLLIAAFQPVWNQPWLAGFGSQPQGRTRVTHQRASAWSRFHMRAGHEDPDADRALVTRIRQHLDLTVPDALRRTMTSTSPFDGKSAARRR